LIIGLTGSLGGGKSTVAAMLEESGGAVVIDADKIAHEVQAPGGSAYEEIVKEFGSGILKLDGTIDRKRLGEIVFENDEKRTLLNSIVHPKVRTEELRLLRENVARPLVVLMVPLLLENKMESMVDCVVVVTTDEENRRKRLLVRPEMTPEKIEARLKTQMPDALKIRRADYVIDNGGSLERTREQVKKLIEQVGQKPLTE
jgi:dephospho-CoA kinase